MEPPTYHQHEEFKNRSEKLAEIRALKIDPYPPKFLPTQSARALQHKYESRQLAGSQAAEAGITEHAALAGRLVLFRPMGKNSFAQLQDSTGRIQLMFNRDQTEVAGLAPLPDLPPIKFIEKKLDLGDFIGVEGHLFRTQKGELTLFVRKVTLLCKTLLPLPDKHKGLSDIEMRYRKRWLDLITHSEVKETFRLRSRIVRLIRNYFAQAGFDEVETPILQNIYGGAEAQPFITQLNALHQQMYLRISLEISLKKLIVGGLEKVFEISKVFRNEGLDRTHNPEFTMLEAYAAYGDYNDMMVLTEELFQMLALELFGTTQIQLPDKTIDVKAPWIRMSMVDAIQHYAQMDVNTSSDEELRNVVLSRGTHDLQELADAPRGSLIAKIFGELVEPHLIQPHHIIDHPIETTPLCKLHRDPQLRRQRFVERFESFINGSEMCNSYTELNDPELQRQLLVQQAGLREQGQQDAHPLDEEFIEAICQGMPPTGGLGIGIDRLVMLFTHAASIRDVLFFPIMRSENPAEETQAKQFRLEALVLEQYPAVKVGVILGKGLNNRHSSPEIVHKLRATENEIRQKYTLEALLALPKIHDWRQAYRKFGFAPSAHRSSVEALLRRVIQGKELPSINPIVDLYNIISMKNVLPAGGDDLGKVVGSIRLVVAEGSEKFIMLGTDRPEPIKKGEVVYRDEEEVLCRSWNYRECEKTKITPETRDVCLVLEGLENTTQDEVEHAVRELKNLLQTYCQGSYSTFFLDKNHPKAPIE